jgi:hypothetical protein
MGDRRVTVKSARDRRALSDCGDEVRLPPGTRPGDLVDCPN